MNQEMYTFIGTLVFTCVVLITTGVYAVKIILQKRREAIQEADLFI